MIQDSELVRKCETHTGEKCGQKTEGERDQLKPGMRTEIEKERDTDDEEEREREKLGVKVLLREREAFTQRPSQEDRE